MTITKVSASTTQTNIQKRAAALAALKKILQEIEPTAQPDVLLAEDTRYGVVDGFLFDKAKPDKNGVYSNVKIIKRTYLSLKDLIVEFQAKPNNFVNETVIAYKPINDNYHYLLIKKMNLKPDNLEKYLLLI